MMLTLPCGVGRCDADFFDDKGLPRASHHEYWSQLSQNMSCLQLPVAGLIFQLTLGFD